MATLTPRQLLISAIALVVLAALLALGQIEGRGNAGQFSVAPLPAGSDRSGSSGFGGE